jgi:hypothetical protein
MGMWVNSANSGVGFIAGDSDLATSAGREKLAVPQHAAIVARKVFPPELETLGVAPGQVHYLEQGLHRHPDELHTE